VDHVKNMIFKPKPAHSASFSDWKNRAESRDVELDLPMFDGKIERMLAYEQVEWAAALLNKDRVDAQTLGMEVLASMTDTKKSSAVTCSIASTAVLRGYIVVDHVNDRDNDQAVTLCMESLFAPLAESSSNGEAGIEEEDEEMNLFSSPYLTSRRLLSMRILKNALLVCYEGGYDIQDLDRGMPYSSWLLGDMDLIVSRLVQTVHAAEDKPHDAVLAMKCLEYIMQLSPRAKRLAYDQNVVQAVGRANVIGKCSHAILELESARVHRILMGQ
jgi:hypothetical protein